MQIESPYFFIFNGNNNVWFIYHYFRDILTWNVYDSLSLTNRIKKVKCKCDNRKVTCNFLCLHYYNVCPVCHRFARYSLWTSQCTRFESLTLKMRSRTLTIWMKINVRIYFFDLHKWAKIGASRPSRLFPVTFRDGCTYIHMYTCLIA